MKVFTFSSCGYFHFLFYVTLHEWGYEIHLHCSLFLKLWQAFSGIFQIWFKNDIKDLSCWFTRTRLLCSQAELIILWFVGRTVTSGFIFSSLFRRAWCVLISSPNYVTKCKFFPKYSTCKFSAKLLN